MNFNEKHNGRLLIRREASNLTRGLVRLGAHNRSVTPVPVRRPDQGSALKRWIPQLFELMLPVRLALLTGLIR